MFHGNRIGRYELIEISSQGEVLVIYRARDTERDRPVLLKMVRPPLWYEADLMERFRREAELLVRLNHPNIVPIREVDVEENVVCLVADVPSGESLERRLAVRGPLDVDDVLSITSQLADALDYAHGQGAFYHVIQPSNIFFDGKMALLVDFHLPDAIGDSPVYVAPEQLDKTSAETADRRTTVYTLGVIIYEMLTGRVPFEGTALEIAAAHLAQRPTPPRIHNSDLLPALDAILLKALARQPQNRYSTAGELATALYEAVQAAQTRRMSDSGVFGRNAMRTREMDYQSSLLDGGGRLLAWVWVGIGVFLAVVISAIVLLVTR